MEIANLGRHALSVCPHCEKLFFWHPENGVPDDGLSGVDCVVDQCLAHITESLKCKKKSDALPSLKELHDAMRPAVQKEEAERRKRIEEHPDNGKIGYWLVTGVRHKARTKALSAREAVEKCRGIVQGWEAPEADFIGEVLPDVF